MKRSFLFILCTAFVSGHCFAPDNDNSDANKYPKEIIQQKNEFVTHTLGLPNRSLLEIAETPEGMGGYMHKNFSELWNYIFSPFIAYTSLPSEEEIHKRKELLQKIEGEISSVKERITPDKIKKHCMNKLPPEIQQFVENPDTISNLKQQFLKKNLTKDQRNLLYVLIQHIKDDK